MEDSILNTVKKLLNVDPSETCFDVDIITHINTVLVILNQLGYGDKPFSIQDEDDLWQDLLGERESDLSIVKSYIYAKVRSMFDPPTGSSVKDALQRTIDELEFRINVLVDEG